MCATRRTPRSPVPPPPLLHRAPASLILLLLPLEIAERAEEVLGLSLRHGPLQSRRRRRLRLPRLRGRGARRRLLWLRRAVARVRALLRGRRLVLILVRVLPRFPVRVVLATLGPPVIPARVGVAGIALGRRPQLAEGRIHLAAPAEQRAEVVAGHPAGRIAAGREVREQVLHAVVGSLLGARRGEVGEQGGRRPRQPRAPRVERLRARPVSAPERRVAARPLALRASIAGECQPARDERGGRACVRDAYPPRALERSGAPHDSPPRRAEERGERRRCADRAEREARHGPLDQARSLSRAGERA